jgi:anti-sigma factor RsiW
MTARVHGLTCEEVLARLSDYLDGELAPDALGALEAHLSACEGCARFGGEFRATVAALRDHVRAGPRLPARIRARLDDLLKDPKEYPEE